MLGVRVPPCTHVHVCLQWGKSHSEPKTSVHGSAEPAEMRSQAASCCTEAQLAFFLRLNGNARLRQKQPLVLTGRSLLAPAPVWVDHFPFPGGLCRCLSRSAAKLVHPRLFLGGGGEEEAMVSALCCEVSERWSQEGDGDWVLHRDHRSKILVAVSSGHLEKSQGFACCISLGETPKEKHGLSKLCFGEEPIPNFLPDGKQVRMLSRRTHHLQSFGCAGH